MASEETAAWLVLLVAVVAVVGIALSAATFVTHNTLPGMMGGGSGMMNGNSTPTQSIGPGSLEWAILLVSAAFFVASIVLWSRGRTMRGEAPAGPAVAAPLAPSANAIPPASAPIPEPLPEVALMKLLGGDEKRMYLELREHGGSMLQKDIVGLGIFSKAKVTRVLDKLEAKGLILREAHGMTNRVRIVNQPAR